MGTYAVKCDVLDRLRRIALRLAFADLNTFLHRPGTDHHLEPDLLVVVLQERDLRIAVIHAEAHDLVDVARDVTARVHLDFAAIGMCVLVLFVLRRHGRVDLFQGHVVDDVPAVQHRALRTHFADQFVLSRHRL
jgi:hypothetical protein